jgi:hypothetical protein
VVALGVLALGCSRSGPKKAAPKPRQSSATLCPGGESEDPGLGRLEDGIAFFEGKDYKKAEAHFAALRAEFPRSATVVAWLADTVLFDKGRSEVAAAAESRPFYEQAFQLHDSGCRMPRRTRYYSLMGDAYGSLRLVRGPGRTASDELARADRLLRLADEEFPSSAEVPYTQARASCARITLGPAGERDFSACLALLERAFKTAESLERPRFLRTHRSTQDWILRSHSQSEFSELRKEPAYQTLLKDVLRDSGP